MKYSRVFSAEHRDSIERGRLDSETPTETEDIEDLVKARPQPSTSQEYCNSEFSCDAKSRENCQRLMKVYQTETISHIKEFTENMKSMRLTVFLVLLLCSMFVVSIASDQQIYRLLKQFSTSSQFH